MESYKLSPCDKLDSECVANLNILTDKLNADIVISSTWRIQGLDYMQELLAEAGVKAAVIDTTVKPNIYDGKRGLEIIDWIKRHNYKGDYLVIDDEIGDIENIIDKKNILWIKKGWFNRGLTLRHVEKVAPKSRGGKGNEKRI